MSRGRKPKTINPDEVDPSVYYYDEVYDDMKNEERVEEATDSRDQTNQGPKYIKGLLETAELRRTEKEVRKFKKYARDRQEAEADGMVDQTEVYITSAYKRKLEEIKRLDEEKRRRIESEEHRMLNIHKKYESKRHESSSTIDIVATRCDRDHESDSPDGSHIDDPQKQASEKASSTTTRQLKTSEDRRQFLREVLSKRTVGDKFNEALERFKHRGNPSHLLK